ncbi:MAG: hypothetical protein MJ215_01250 [Spirochaetia bacterium]|nr:hypothetical protein [Spirochaetia bacterium]
MSIVKMKKVSLVVLDREREESLTKLRELGLVHIERIYAGSDKLAALNDQKAVFERCSLILPQGIAGDKKKKGDLKTAKALAADIIALGDKLKALTDEKEKYLKDAKSLEPWGDFKPADVAFLKDKGVDFKFYELSKEKLDEIADKSDYFVVNTIKNKSYVVVTGATGKEFPAEEPVHLPEFGITECNAKAAALDGEISKVQKELEKLAADRNVLADGLKELDKEIEFESVSADMQVEGDLAYIDGYVPVDKAAELKAAAAKEHWALLIDDPSEEDAPPSLIRNPKWVERIQPLFKFLDITPGYREADISMWFLMFFTLYVAMIVGDAGYGCIFFILTLLICKKAPKPVVSLLLTLSLGTIVWGTLTGTWFGSETIVKNTFLGKLVIPQIASFAQEGIDTNYYIQNLCFFIGITQLLLGLIISFIRKMPSLAAWTDVGWMLVVVASYFVAQKFVLGAASFNPITWPLAAAGFVIVCLCSEQNGNVVKGICMGLAWSPMKILDTVSMFANLVSYIRLFAVGLATVAVATSFNGMAAGMAESMGVVGIIIGAVILFIAHAFNMVLALLSIIVHGVRLNTLEFGGRVGLEWSGYRYAPFKK